MKNQVFAKLKELVELIQEETSERDESVIFSEHYDESVLIGTETSFLELIKILSELILANRGIIQKSDDYERESDNSIWSSEIKKAISEYSDCRLVSIILQDKEQFALTLKDQYKKWVESHGGNVG